MNLIIQAKVNWKELSCEGHDTNDECSVVHCPEYCWGGGEGPCNESVCPTVCLTQT